MAQTIKNLPAIHRTWVVSLDWEVCPEKEMATHSSILAWEIPWTEEPGGVDSPWGRQRSLAIYRRNKYTWNEWEKKFLKSVTINKYLFTIAFPTYLIHIIVFLSLWKKSWQCYKHVKSSSVFNVNLFIYRKKINEMFSIS